MKNIRNRKIYIKIKINPIHMNIKNKMKLLFKSIFTQFGSVVSAEGQQIIWDQDGELAVGYDVYMEQEDENGELQYVPVPDGEYRVEDKVIVIVDGKVSEIKEETTVEPEEKPAEMEETPAPEQPADPTTAEVVTTDEEPFDPEKAYAELKSMYDALKGEVEVLKEQLGKLLEVPVEKHAFSEAKKNKEVEQKQFMCKVAHK